MPPIVITKAHSIASVKSSLVQSTSASAVVPDTKSSVPLEQDAGQNGSAVADAQSMSEKPPVIIEERTQVHDYGEPPNPIEHSNDQATISKVKPIVINSPESMSEPTIVPASDIPQAKAAAVEAGILAPSSNESTPLEPSAATPAWSILVRRNSSSSKDITIEIPTIEPFMTVLDVKRKIHVEAGQQIKLIHLGKILQDSATLVPSSCSKSQVKPNAVRVANRGVIQAMVYKI